MVEKTVPVGPGTRVTLRFRLSLDSGEEIDKTGPDGATFDFGDGSLLPGFEASLSGMHAGDQKKIKIEAASGFGEENEENYQWLPRASFSKDIGLEVGLVVSFADQNDSELPGVIRRIVGDRVEVNFNHPLAGKDIWFEVEIIGVEQVSNEILRM